MKSPRRGDGEGKVDRKCVQEVVQLTTGSFLSVLGGHRLVVLDMMVGFDCKIRDGSLSVVDSRTEKQGRGQEKRKTEKREKEKRIEEIWSERS